MNWITAAVFAYVLLALERALAMEHLALPITHSSPSFLLPLLVFIALHAPAAPTLWTAVALGLATDLTAPLTVHGAPDIADRLIVVGPCALGFLLAAYFVLTIRGVMIRRNPLTLIFLSVVAAALAQILASTLLTVRSWLDPSLDWSFWTELATRLLSALYTAAAAAALAYPLRWSTPLFGFQDPYRRPPRRF